MSLASWFRGLFFKNSELRMMIALDAQGREPAPDWKYKEYADSGYQQNVIAFRCINLITDAVSRIPLCLYRKTASGDPEEVHEHPAKQLLTHPNPLQSGQQLTKAAMSYLLISGNEYLECAGGNNFNQTQPPLELWAHQPDYFKIIPGANGLPSAFRAKVGSQDRVFPVDILGRSNIIHLKTFNPLDPWYGLSPMKAAAYNIEQLNEADKWNYSLLRRGARPSLAFVVKSEDGKPGSLTENQRQQLQNDIEKMYGGSTNAGRPMLLEGGMDVKELSLSPKEMEFPGIKKLSQKDVALVFGVPGQLVGVEGSLTFANFEEAKMAFYLDTAVPWCEFWISVLNSRLLPRFGDPNLYLALDLDRVEALAPIRDKRWARVTQATFLTTNEKRAMVDYGKYEMDEELEDRDPGDVILVPTMQAPLEQIAGPALDAEPDEGDYEKPQENPLDEGDDGDEDVDEGDAQEDDNQNDEDDGTEIDKARRPARERKALELINQRSQAGKQRAARALDELRERHENAMAKDLLRFFTQQKHTLKAAFGRHVGSDVMPLVVTNAVAKGDAALHTLIVKHLRNVVEAAGRPILKQGKSLPIAMETKDADSVWEHSMQLFIENEAGKNVTKVQGTTKKRLIQTIREAMEPDDEGQMPSLSDIADAIEERFDSMAAGRAMTIARTETHNAASYATRKAAEALKVPTMTKEWVPVQDKRTRESHADMADYGPIEMHEKFIVDSDDGPDEMDGPGDPNASPGNLCNCRCVLVFDTGDGGEE